MPPPSPAPTGGRERPEAPRAGVPAARRASSLCISPATALGGSRCCHPPPTATSVPSPLGAGTLVNPAASGSGTPAAAPLRPCTAPVSPQGGLHPRRPQPGFRDARTPGPRSLPAPPAAARQSPQAVLPALTHTHTLSPVPARRAHTLAFSSVRCQGMQPLPLSPASPFPVAPFRCPAVEWPDTWALSRGALHTSAISQPAGITGVPAMPRPSATSRAPPAAHGTGACPRRQAATASRRGLGPGRLR